MFLLAFLVPFQGCASFANLGTKPSEFVNTGEKRLVGQDLKDAIVGKVYKAPLPFNFWYEVYRVDGNKFTINERTGKVAHGGTGIKYKITDDQLCMYLREWVCFSVYRRGPELAIFTEDDIAKDRSKGITTLSTKYAEYANGSREVALEFSLGRP